MLGGSAVLVSRIFVGLGFRVLKRPNDVGQVEASSKLEACRNPDVPHYTPLKPS